MFQWIKTRAMAVFQNKKNPVLGIHCVFKIMKTPVIASVSTDANVVYGSSLSWRNFMASANLIEIQIIRSSFKKSETTRWWQLLKYM
jgi:hypothetical protein